MNDREKVIFGVVENDVSFSSYLTGLLYELPKTKKVIEFESAELAIRYFQNPKNNNTINFLIVDYKLKNMDGIRLLGQDIIKKQKIPKLILTGFDAEEKIFEALKFGATGYLLKEELSSLETIIDILINGGAHISPVIAIRVASYFQSLDKSQETFKNLTAREIEILQQLSEGFTTPELSKNLNIRITTIRTHIRNIYKKLEINNRTQLIKILKKNK